MIRRLICLLREHRGVHYHHEWVFGTRIVWLNECGYCGMQTGEGSSDGWLIPFGLFEVTNADSVTISDSESTDVSR
jgi:hypothetical protein